MKSESLLAGMAITLMTRRFLFAALASTFITGVPGTPLLAEADGPDYWRVEGVSENDVLNIRTASNPRAEKIGEIPPGSGCIRNLGCVGGVTLKEAMTMTAAEQAVIRRSRPRWCRIEFQGTTGWVHAHYLREDTCVAEQNKPEVAIESPRRVNIQFRLPLPDSEEVATNTNLQPASNAQMDTDKTHAENAGNAVPAAQESREKTPKPEAPPANVSVAETMIEMVTTAEDKELLLPSDAHPDTDNLRATTSADAQVPPKESANNTLSPEPTHAAGFRIETGKHHPRGSYMVHYAENPEECAGLCRDDTQCIGFDYNTRFEACWLKDKLFPARDNDEFITGVKEL